MSASNVNSTLVDILKKLVPLTVYILLFSKTWQSNVHIFGSTTFDKRQTDRRDLETAPNKYQCAVPSATQS